MYLLLIFDSLGAFEDETPIISSRSASEELRLFEEPVVMGTCVGGLTR